MSATTRPGATRPGSPKSSPPKSGPARDYPAPAQTALTSQRIVIRDMTLTCWIGLTDEERARSQRLRLNLEIDIRPSAPNQDEISEVVHYGHLVKRIRQTCLDSDVRLLETLADKVVEACFFDERVTATRVRIEKLDRYPDVGGIGIEIERHRKDA